MARNLSNRSPALPFADGRAVILNRSELLSRMEEILQRKAEPQSVPPFLQVGDLFILSAERSATWRGRRLPLTPKEFDILVHLAKNPGKVLSRECLFDVLWDEAFAGRGRLIDRHIMKVRQKLRDGAWLIESVWGVGYRLVSSSVPAGS